MSVINREDAIKALEDVGAIFPYRIPGVTETYRPYNEAWNDAIDEAEKAIETLPDADDGWIPCSKRLPEEDDYNSCIECPDGAVWYFTENGTMGIGYYYESTKEWSTTDDLKTDGKVVAWRPLPPAFRPKEDK